MIIVVIMLILSWDVYAVGLDQISFFPLPILLSFYSISVPILLLIISILLLTLV